MALKHKHQRSEEEEDPQSSVLMLFTEIIVQILLKLPVESLLRCKSVCKSWYSLISDPQFVKSHLALSAGNLNCHQLMFTTGPKIMKRCNLYDVFYNLSINVSDIYYPPKHIRRVNVRFVGSCNGLVCINDGGFGLSIWNPSTRKFNILPNCEHQFRGRFWIFIYGFGYDASTDNYKVVKLSCNIKDTTNCETFVRIYSLKDGTWKEVFGFPKRFRCYGFGKFSNGALHWSARNKSQLSTILSLDLATETYREILLPPYDASDRDVKLGSLGEWLCGVCIYPGIRADLWEAIVFHGHAQMRENTLKQNVRFDALCWIVCVMVYGKHGWKKSKLTILVNIGHIVNGWSTNVY
ncbi:F-box/kelch-repeat protein At3g23880-like [Bidens hawaiensis]|uniref:F-box/kelch-repeat protein At3g23880-like n=1 Tax=Bidens hawaiensis TaxID=980011 RepID=UPI004049AA16